VENKPRIHIEEFNKYLKTVQHYVILLYHIPDIYEGSTNDLFTPLDIYIYIYIYTHYGLDGLGIATLWG